jgi:hypothetical protein
MENFFFGVPTRAFFGRDQIQYLDLLLKREAASRVLLVYGQGSIKRSGVYEAVLAELNRSGIPHVECAGIGPNPPLSDVERGIRLCREEDIDFILAVGGGSVIDASKAMSAGAPYEGDVRELLGHGAGKLAQALPLGVVLTVAGTGSELNSGAVLTVGEDHKKISMIHPLLYPRFSILDPTYTYSVPEYHSMAGCFDTLSHLMESYFLPDQTTEVQDRMNEGVMKVVLRNAPLIKADPECYDARANIMWASSMALAGFQFYLGKSVIDFPVHTLSHELSSLYGMTHGVALAALTPSWMRYALQRVPESVSVFAAFARNVLGIRGDADDMEAARGIELLESFIRSIGLPTCLRTAGARHEDLRYLARKATEDGPISGLYPIEETQAWEIFSAAWNTDV